MVVPGLVLVATSAACLVGASGVEEAAPPGRPAVEVRDVRFPEGLARAVTTRGAWIPIYVELATSGTRAQQVRIEAGIEESRKRIWTTAEAVEVAPGAPRRAWVHVLVHPDTDALQTIVLQVVASDGSTIRTGDAWSVAVFAQEQQSLRALIAGDPRKVAAPWPEDIARAAGARQQLHVASDILPPRALPDRVLGYQGFDVVVLLDPGDERLEPGQIEALRRWVHLGGTLVLAPSSRSADAYRSQLAREILGDDLVEVVERKVAPGTARWVDRTGPSEAPGIRPRTAIDTELAVRDAEITVLDPLAPVGAVEIRALRDPRAPGREEGDRVYAEVSRGSGRVGVFMAFAEDRSGPSGEAVRSLWGILLQAVSGRRGPSVALDRSSLPERPDVDQVLRDTSRDVGFHFVVGLVGGYLLLMGPVVYAFLRWRRNLSAVIWVEPVLVLGYLGIVFAVAYITKGVLTKTRAWTIISQVRGDPVALRESWLTVFSAAEETYSVTAPRADLLQPVFRDRESRRPIRLRAEAAGPEGARGITIEGFRLAQWEQAHFASLEAIELGPGVKVARSGGVRDGSAPGRAGKCGVENGLPYPILSGLVSDLGDRWYAVGRIDPGRSVEVDAGPAAPVSVLPPSWSELLPRARRLAEVGARGAGRRLSFVGLVQRDDLDFRLDRRSTPKDRMDLYLLLED